jgi:outer membrane immunogenic protein
MLRIRTLGASAAALLASAAVAAAADIPPYGQPPAAAPSYYNAAPAYSWSGPYVGLTGGYGWASTSPTTSPNRGWIGGAYAGANFQTDTNLVVGIEGDVTATGKTGTSGGLTVSNPWDATLRGRIGFALDRVLVYGTGGVAVGGLKAVSGAGTDTATQAGWTAGAGVEAALAQNVTGRLEFRHTDLGTVSAAKMPNNGPISYSSNDVMAGIGLKF